MKKLENMTYTELIELRKAIQKQLDENQNTGILPREIKPYYEIRDALNLRNELNIIREPDLYINKGSGYTSLLIDYESHNISDFFLRLTGIALKHYEVISSRGSRSANIRTNNSTLRLTPRKEELYKNMISDLCDVFKKYCAIADKEFGGNENEDTKNAKNQITD